MRLLCTPSILAASLAVAAGCSSNGGSGSGGGGAATTSTASTTGSGGASSCKDGAINGAETDIDCGGPACAACSAGQACALDRDCAAGSCVLGKCSAPCADGAQDGDETDVDCGGATCAKCDDGKHCAAAGDCRSGRCQSGACAGNLGWARQLGGADEQQATSVAVNAAGDVFVAGSTMGAIDLGGGPHAPALSVAPFLLALGESGDTLLEEVIDGTGLGAITGAVAADATGGVYLAGTLAGSIAVDASTTLASTNGTEGDAFAAHVLGSGQAAWAKAWGSASTKGLVRAAAADPAGGVALAGVVEGDVDFGCGLLAGATARMFVVKLDAQGDCVWSLAPGKVADTGVGLAVDADGNTIVAGGSHDMLDFGGKALAAPGAEQIFAAKLDAAGSVVYLKGFLPQYGGGASALAVDAAGNAVIAGTLSGTANFGIGPMGNGQPGLFVAKLDPSGATLTSQVWEAHASDVRVAADAAGNFALAGSFSFALDLGGGPLGPDGAFVATFDASGAHRWSRRYDCAISGVAFAPQGWLAISGWFVNPLDLGGGPLTSAGKGDGFVAQLVVP